MPVRSQCRRSAASWPGSPGVIAQARGLEVNTWIASAPTAAAYASPLAARPPAAGTCAPIGALCGVLSRTGSTTRSETGEDRDRASLRGLAVREVAKHQVERADLADVHLESELFQRILGVSDAHPGHIRDGDLLRSRGDDDGQRLAWPDRGSRRWRLPDDGARRLGAAGVLLHVQRDAVALCPLLGDLHVLARKVRQRRPLAQQDGNGPQLRPRGARA